MDLTPGQRFALQEMGIPVWELREQLVDEKELSPVVEQEFASQTSESLTLDHADCLIIIEQQNELEQDKQRLLNLMLRVAEIPEDRSEVVSLEQFMTIDKQNIPENKFVLLFGSDIAEQLVEDYKELDEHLGKACKIKESSCSAFACESLSTLMQEPSKKYGSWLSLIKAGEFYRSLS